MRVRDKGTSTENIRCCAVLSPRRKLRKTLGRDDVQLPPHPSLYVRGLNANGELSRAK